MTSKSCNLSRSSRFRITRSHAFSIFVLTLVEHRGWNFGILWNRSVTFPLTKKHHLPFLFGNCMRLDLAWSHLSLSLSPSSLLATSLGTFACESGIYNRIAIRSGGPLSTEFRANEKFRKWIRTYSECPRFVSTRRNRETTTT